MASPLPENESPAQQARQCLLRGVGHTLVVNPFMPTKDQLGTFSPTRAQLAHDPPFTIRNTRQMVDRLRQVSAAAPIFSLDTDCSNTAAEIANNQFWMLGEFFDRIRLPFASMWLEWQLRSSDKSIPNPESPTRICAFLSRKGDGPSFYIHPVTVFHSEKLGKTSTIFHTYAIEVDPTGDNKPRQGVWHRKLGECLATNNPLTMIVGNNPNNLPVSYLDAIKMEYNFDRPESVYTRFYIWGQVATLAGVTPNTDSDTRIAVNFSPGNPNPFNNPYLDTLNQIQDNVAIKLDPFCLPIDPDTVISDDDKRLMGQMLIEHNGTARKILAILVMLNLRDHIVDVSPGVRPQRTLSHKSAGPYLIEHRIRLIVPEPVLRPRLEALRREHEHMARRRHDVRGSWCQRRRGPGAGNLDCFHTFEHIDPDHRVCRHCGHQQWWRKDHQRGDASLGFVRHSYNVERAKDKPLPVS